MSDGEYFVRRVAFPNRAARACVIQNDDGSFDIFLNTLWPEDALAEALEHELRHIRGGHFDDRDADALHDEAEACGLCFAADARALSFAGAAGEAERRKIPLLSTRDEMMTWLRDLR